MAEKSFDCVKMMHDIRAQIARETEGMNWDEYADYIHRRAESAFPDLFGRKQGAPASDAARRPPHSG